MDERCDANERHCACVPLLRAEVERLRGERDAALDDVKLYATGKLEEHDELVAARDRAVAEAAAYRAAHACLEGPAEDGVWESAEKTLAQDPSPAVAELLAEAAHGRASTGHAPGCNVYSADRCDCTWREAHGPDRAAKAAREGEG
jgi:hypothetical protein